MEREEAAPTTKIKAEVEEGMISMVVTKNRNQLTNPKSNDSDVTDLAITALNAEPRCTKEREQNQILQRRMKFLF